LPPLEYFLLIPLGFTVGMYGTLIGAGGGFVLVPVLLFLYPDENPGIITCISLAVVFVNALSGSAAYARMKRIDYKSGLIMAAATIPGAIGGTLLVDIIPRNVFNIMLGVMLTLGSLLILFTAKNKIENAEKVRSGEIPRRIVEKDGTEHNYSFNLPGCAGTSTIVGFLSSLLGIGGGIIHVPLLSRVFRFPVHIATATSHFVLAIMALTATIVNIISGEFSSGWRRTAFLAVGVLLGAQLGAMLSGKIKGPWIIRALALALFAVGIRLFFTL